MHVALQTPDVERTRTFYADVLGWSYLPDGRVDGAVPSIGFGEGTSQITCEFAVNDLVAAVDRLRAAGGEAREIQRHPWGLVAECLDDQGTAIRLHEVLADPGGTPPASVRRVGHPSYLTLEIVDSGRARAFYTAVLGWQVAPGRVADGWQVQDTAPMIGLSGGHGRATTVPVWTVRNVAAAIAAVRERGGSATEPHREPYGTVTECVDDQGLRFTSSRSERNHAGGCPQITHICALQPATHTGREPRQNGGYGRARSAALVTMSYRRLPGHGGCELPSLRRAVTRRRGRLSGTAGGCTGVPGLPEPWF